MISRSLRLSALLVVLTGGLACGPSVNLQTDLEVTEVFTGWYDNGIADNGWNHMIPSISFRLKNVTDHPVDNVLLTVAFWMDGADGEMDSSQVRGIGSDALAPDAETDLLTVRASVGYNLEAPRAELFLQRTFEDVTAKLFARRSGRIVPIGEFRIDRRLIPHVTTPGPSAR